MWVWAMACLWQSFAEANNIRLPYEPVCVYVQ